MIDSRKSAKLCCFRECTKLGENVYERMITTTRPEFNAIGMQKPNVRTEEGIVARNDCIFVFDVSTINKAAISYRCSGIFLLLFGFTKFLNE